MLRNRLGYSLPCGTAMGVLEPLVAADESQNVIDRENAWSRSRRLRIPLPANLPERIGSEPNT